LSVAFGFEGLWGCESEGGSKGFRDSEFSFVVRNRVFHDFCECNGFEFGCDFSGEVSRGDTIGYGGFYWRFGVRE